MQTKRSVEGGSPADITVSGYSVLAVPQWRQNVLLNDVIKKFFIMDEQWVFLRFVGVFNLIREFDTGYYKYDRRILHERFRLKAAP